MIKRKSEGFWLLLSNDAIMQIAYWFSNRVDVRGRKYVQAHFSPEKGQKHIYAQEHQLYYYNYNNFRGHLEKKFKTVNDFYNTPSFDSAFI